MKLEISEWKEFKFGNLVSKIYKAKALNKDDLTETVDRKYSIRYITRTGENNGCELLADISYVEAEYIQDSNAITIGDTTATCFYQDEQFIAGDHMVVVRAEWLNKILGMYMVAILNKEQYKYSYGRAFLRERIKNTIIKLPIKYSSDNIPFIDNKKRYSEEGYVPDWEWMEKYIKSLNYKPLNTKNVNSDKIKSLNVENWRAFEMSKLFEVSLSKGDIKLEEVEAGDIALISSGESNNGIVGYIDRKGDGKANIFDGNKITIDMFGNSFYQKEEFYAVSHGRVNILSPLFDMNEYSGIFIATIIKQEQYKYSYGRALYSEEAVNMSIKLPIKHNIDGTTFIDDSNRYSAKGYVPDWDFMEKYIKALPYGDRL